MILFRKINKVFGKRFVNKAERKQFRKDIAAWQAYVNTNYPGLYTNMPKYHILVNHAADIL